MDKISRVTVRRFIAVGFAVLAMALLWLLLGALQTGLALWQQIAGLHWSLQALVGTIVTGFAGVTAWAGWRLLRPRRPHRNTVPPPDRATIERRVERLAQLDDTTASFSAELAELDARRQSGECYVAVFGEISAGKSSLIRALAPDADNAVDVLGGTTRQVAHHRGRLGERELVLADVPGTQEVDAREHETLARDEALRAHAVVYVCTGDLTRQQDGELRWLHGFGKPLLLALNKVDLLSAAQRDEVRTALDARYRDVVDAVVPVRAGGVEHLERRLPDGRREQVTREATPDTAALAKALSALVATDADTLEAAREGAVLGHLAERLGAAERSARSVEAYRIVDRYTRRAVVGALAAIAPGTDLIIQGALATGLIRELAALYDVPVKTLDLDAFLEQAGGTLRTTSSIVLAIAGNALKAFPGLGTLSGGVLHAVAYGLIFDSLGCAVVRTLAEHHRLDQAAATDALRELLTGKSAQRLGHIANLALESLRDATTGNGHAR
ncbi:GTPase [Tahibacter amnicola]|uniref:50S ribosome-binding GTPase n=1 Tax=Tahibacter amnicola TaxID=2976241 RepID=A0ABY6BHI0_9GAMM|nr:GTPase [Tahibacter amnicola]UXI69329.1 50S ribosome-binding GTPase [Tahibacter amnicola]